MGGGGESVRGEGGLIAQRTIDWSRPWFAPYRTLGAQAMNLVASGLPVHRALQSLATAQAIDTHPTSPSFRLPTFVDADVLPRGVAYETFIHGTGSVPTRHNLHDFFNGLVWLHEPSLKWRLNALQAEALARDGVQATRGALRDALTLFDENGALVTLPRAVADALRSKHWHAAFVVHGSAWTLQTVRIVGHALLEKLALAPRKALTAHALLQAPTLPTASDWAEKPFAPLPVMGVPGWHALQDDAFYADAQVFRL